MHFLFGGIAKIAYLCTRFYDIKSLVKSSLVFVLVSPTSSRDGVGLFVIYCRFSLMILPVLGPSHIISVGVICLTTADQG